MRSVPEGGGRGSEIDLDRSDGRAYDGAMFSWMRRLRERGRAASGNSGERPLACVPAGRRVRILRVAAGRGLARRMQHMGLEEGMEVRVLRNNGGQVIVAQGHARTALGRGITRKIFVEDVSRP